MSVDEPVRTRADRPRARRSADLRRARMLLAAHAGWLGGYPDPAAPAVRGAVAWRAAPGAPAAAPVDRATLAATTRALHELHRDYGPVLPALVGDVPAWQRGVDAAIAALKAAVHDRVPPPALWEAYPGAVRAAAARLAGDAALATVLRAVSWRRLGQPKAAAADLRWIDGNRAAVAAIAGAPDGLARALAIREVAAADGDARAAPLIALVADPTLAEVTALPGDHVERLIGWLASGHKRPAGRLPPVGRVLHELADWIAAQPAPVRRRALRTLALLDLPDTLRRWRAYWADVDRHVAHGARGLARTRGQRHAELGAAVKALRELRHAAPPPVPRELVSDVQTVAVHATDEDLDLIEAIPRAPSMPHALELVDHVAGRAVEEPALAAAQRATLSAYLAARRDEPLRMWIEPVIPLLTGRAWPWHAARLYRRAAAWRGLRDALIAAMRAGLAIQRDELAWFAALAAAAPGADDVVARVAALGAERPSLEPVTAQIAAIVSELPGVPLDARARTFVAIATRLGDVRPPDENDDGPDENALVELVQDVAPSGRAVLVTVITDAARDRLRDAAAALQTARSLRGRPPRLELPDAAEPPPWAARAPAPLAPALALAETAGLGDTARRRLDELVGDPARLTTEIAAIDARLPAATGEARARLTARRANLAARIAAPPPPRPARVARLADELTRAAHLALFDRWRAALDAYVAEALPRSLGVDPATASVLLAPPHRPLVRGIALLEPADRALALRVLAARTGPPPWDLRDAPPNRAFVAGLAARGVDPAPWLDGIGPRRDGDLVLALEDDPLEILHMGRHFGTCLSPGAVNFYSAVVNAADINKRVVYGRVDGKVVGRCLLALTDDGAIVTFYPYHHVRGFEAAVRAFVAALAEAMGTIVVAGGRIRPLLHPRWYDDGARDLTGRFEFLAHGSAFRHALLEIPPERLVAELTARFAPLPLAGYTLGLVLRLDEVIARPELGVPLAPLVARADDLPLDARLRATELLERAGRADLIDPRLADHLDRALRHSWRLDEWMPHGVLDRLAAIAPVRALAFLRDTRPRRGAPRHHQHGERLLGEARALEALRRPRQALVRYREALPLLHGDELARCRARIAALGAPPSGRRVRQGVARPA